MADPIDDGVNWEAAALRDWLRQLKADSGASFHDIARAIGEEERTVKRWMPERADAKVVIPRGDALLKLLDYFGVTLNPPAPRVVALSLLGELREVRESIVGLEGDEAGEELGLRRIDRRLRELSETVTDALNELRLAQDAQTEAHRQEPGEAPASHQGAP